jgi:hypothetical protein
METTLSEIKKREKKGAIIALLAASIVIILLGLGFGIYAVINNVTFPVMSYQLPGAIFAAVMVFLGVRYFLASLKLNRKIQGKAFSWNNFKFKKTVKGKKG